MLKLNSSGLGTALSPSKQASECESSLDSSILQCFCVVIVSVRNNQETWGRGLSFQTEKVNKSKLEKAKRYVHSCEVPVDQNAFLGQNKQILSKIK